MATITVQMHAGEISMAKRLQLPYDPRGFRFHPEMPLQHQIFFSNLPYFIFGNLDAKGRPWVSIITGEPGFVTAATPNKLDVNVNISKWDPIVRNLQEAKNSEAKTPYTLFSGLGVDFSNRRRNKVAGIIEANSIGIADVGGDRVNAQLRIVTQESLGNCPKYITVRSLKYSPRDAIQLAHDHFELPQDFNGLPQECQDSILQVDTMFISTRHYATQDDLFPLNDMDVNIRGGPKGFVRILPGGKKIVWPDFSGNRMYQSLGNIESDRKLGMVFPNFTTGDMVYVTGEAENILGDEATNIMPSCQLVTVLTITGYIFVKGGLDIVQQTPTVDYSPYNPPVRYLKSEASLHPLARDPTPTPIILSDITPITRNICSFTFSLPPGQSISYIPGQHALIDFSTAKPKQYSHMNEARPQRLNDDFVRSWTISSIPPVDSSGTHFAPASSLTCTIKLNEAGEITPFIYSYARISPNQRPPLKLAHRGVNGTFTVFDLPPTPTSPLTLTNKNLVFIAGGIGITPFLSFHAAIQNLHLPANVSLLFSGRNDELLLAAPFFTSTTPPAPLLSAIKLFQTGNSQDTPTPFPQVHTRRMEKADVEEVLGGKEGIEQKTVFLCGPVGFMEIVVNWLDQLGVSPDRIRQEAFNF